MFLAPDYAKNYPSNHSCSAGCWESEPKWLLETESELDSNSMKNIQIIAPILFILTLAGITVFPSGSLAFGGNENEKNRQEEDRVAFQAPDAVPRIDPEAAFIVKESSDEINSFRSCGNLTQNIWALIFSAYLLLMIFNFAYDFDKIKSPHWFWEALYTLLALYAWYSLDKCRTNIWFPLVVIESSLIIFGFYVYVFKIKNILENNDDEE